jgi:SH3 domain protein
MTMPKFPLKIRFRNTAVRRTRFPGVVGGLGLLVVIALLSDFASAQTRYVSDDLVITLRTGPSTQNAIIRNLKTGDSMTVLEDREDEGYSRVRTADGTEGWVLRQYLTAMPVARTQLAGAQRELAQARQRVAELEARIGELSGELDMTTARMQTAETQLAEVSSELVDVRSASANALTARDQNESLRRRLNDRDLLVEQLTTENALLASRSNREWFLLGAGVLVVGIILGLIIPSLRRKRRTDW